MEGEEPGKHYGYVGNTGQEEESARPQQGTSIVLAIILLGAVGIHPVVRPFQEHVPLCVELLLGTVRTCTVHFMRP